MVQKPEKMTCTREHSRVVQLKSVLRGLNEDVDPAPTQ
jgi:hypothetical protein